MIFKYDYKYNMTNKAHGQTDPSKTGPRPKQLVEGTIKGYAVGRDKTVVPPEDVVKLAQIGCKDNEIAEYFGIAYDTLRYNFADELTKGRASLKITLRRKMFDNALNHNNTVMQIWLSKNYLGMTDSPIDNEANAPLPWIEAEEEELEDGDQHRTE
jgi:hypothetical protein